MIQLNRKFKVGDLVQLGPGKSIAIVIPLGANANPHNRHVLWLTGLSKAKRYYYHESVLRLVNAE